MNQPESPLEIRDLRKQFGDTVAVDGIDLTLGQHELLALVGPSGCGKSTVLRMIAGLVHADSGSIRLGGALADDGRTQLPPERRAVGLVFQEHALFPHLSVAENVAFGVRSDSNPAGRVAEMLDLVDLGAYGQRYPHELSGGERQRVALARALAPRPDLMLFDEPFASLDHNLRVQLRRHVSEVLKETGTPGVFVTHDQYESLSIGDRIAVMQGGRLLQVGTPEQIFHSPADRFVGSFMGPASFLPIRRTADSWETILGPVDGADAAVAGATGMVRPDDVVFHHDGEGAARIVASEYTGTHWLVTAELDDGTPVRLLTSHLDEPKIGARGHLTLAVGHDQPVVLP